MIDQNNHKKIDHDKVREAVTMLLQAIGEDTAREGLIETPDRIARMCDELFVPLDGLPALFNKVFSAAGSEPVLERDIGFYSVCEHHLLPFFGVCHVMYVPDGKVLGLSKIARVVDLIARCPQIQEKMTMQIADAFMEHLKPKGVMVAASAEHLCLSMRGIKKPGAKTFTTATRGIFCTDSELRERFLSQIKS